MDNPRADKVAVVEEVRARLGAATATVVTEYRGLSVADLAELRRSLDAAGGEYKVFKNTLVRLAVAGGDHADLADLLTGPTAIAFVREDISAVAKALRDFGRTNTHLVVKGGMFEGSLLTTADLAALADLPSRDVLLAQVAGTIAAPLTNLAGLLKALTQNLAFGLSALLDQRRSGEPAGEPDAGEPDAGEPDAGEPDQGTEAVESAEAAESTETTATAGGTEDG